MDSGGVPRVAERSVAWDRPALRPYNRIRAAVRWMVLAGYQHHPARLGKAMEPGMKAFAKPKAVLDEHRAGSVHPRPFVAHDSPTADGLLSMQRLAGNRAATTLLSGHSLPVQRSGDSESREDQQREFSALIDRFNREGLPTKFLAITYPQIGLEKISANEQPHYVFDTQTMDVPEGEVVHNRSGPGTIYHESVHAFFDIHKDDPDVKKLIDAERLYYQLSFGKPFGHPEKGRFLFDAERVFQEAAAEYTGNRIDT